MSDFWPDCGYTLLQQDDRGGLRPTADWWRMLLQRAELLPVAESCATERALHRSLLDQPLQAVTDAALAALADADVRDNYRAWLDLRAAVQAAETLQACYAGQFRRGRVTLAPVFLDLMAQAVLRHLLDTDADAFEARAAEMLFRPQRVTLQEGRVLAADRETLERLQSDGGFGSLGRLLAQAQTPLRRADLAVLGADNQAEYWQDAGRYRFVLDLTHSLPKTLAHGLSVPLTRSHSGLTALARVLQRWVEHLLGVRVRITPLARIDEPNWVWHLGLDAESSRLLDALYQGATPDAAALERLLGLFSLNFEDASQVLPTVAGRPVYLGLAMTEDRLLRIKPQNLLLNLPLASH